MDFEILNTERLILRKLTPNDYDFIFENYSENEIRNILGVNSDDDFKIEVRKNKKGYSTYHTTILSFQIIDNKTHNIIGKCGFHNWYMEHCRAELGFALTNENYRNKGIMKEALKAVMEYGFEKMKLNKKLPARSRAKADYLLTTKLFWYNFCQGVK